MTSQEADLVRRCRSGEEAAFRQIVQRYERPIYYLAWRMVANDEDARDIAQETFIKAFRALDTFDETRSFSAWINRIAVNLSYDLLRKRRHRMVSIHEDPEDPDRRPPILVDGRDLPDGHLEKTRGQERLEAICERLSPPYRIVIHLRYIQQLSYEEIADVLEMPLNTVKARLFRAHRTIQSWIENRTAPEPARDLDHGG